MKTLLLILFFFSYSYTANCQTDTSSTDTSIDTAVIQAPPVVKPVKRRPPVNLTLRNAVKDSIRKADSVRLRDSLPGLKTDSGVVSTVITPPQVKRIVVKRPIDSFYLKLLDNPFLRTRANPVFLVINERERVTKDEFFYLMAGILLFLAFIKLVFGRFFTNLFRLFFQPSFRQKQTREQLQQNNLPSLLLNLLFVLSAAAYISFLLDYYKFSHYGFWWLFLYSVAALTIIYIGKFIFLSFAGWVFNVKEATNAYIFAVYLINKILAIVLIPFTLVIAFSDTGIINICITLSILIILLLFIYRYIVSYVPVRKEVKVRPLHFFFYILAFEITPLLVIYKTLLIYLNKSL